MAPGPGNSDHEGIDRDKEIIGGGLATCSLAYLISSGTRCSSYWLYCYTSTVGCDEDEVALLAARQG